MSLLALFSVLRARAIIIFWAIMVATIAALLVARVVPQTYEASAKVQVDSIQENLLTGLVEPRLRVSEFLGQQAAIVTSRTVALKVVDILTLEGYISIAQYESNWREITGGELVPGNDSRLWTADQLIEDLVVRSNVAESTLTITYRGDSPSNAARFSNAFADAYMITVLEQRQRRAARNAENFSEETDTLEQQVQESREELTAFQQQSGIVTIGVEQAESAEVELASLTSRMAEARADHAEAQSLFDQVRQTPKDKLGTIPLPAYDTPGRTAQARLAAIASQLERLGQRYGENHPDYLESLSELENQQNIIYSTVKGRAEYTGRRVKKLSQEVAGQKSRVVDLQQTRQRFDTLEKNLDTNRQAYDLLAARTLQEGLQSRFDTIDVLLLSRAVPPQEPLLPIDILIILAGAMLGFCMGMSAAVVVELLEARLRSREGLQLASKADVLAEIRVPGMVKGRYYA